MKIEEMIAEIKELSIPGEGFKPHKLIALLAVLYLIRDGLIVTPEIQFSDEFKTRFGELLVKYKNENDRNRPHTPFFHLSNTSFWRLIPNKGQESVLRKADTIGSSGELRKLVSHVEMDRSVYDLFADRETGKTIESILLKCIEEGNTSRLRSNSSERQQLQPSIFPHEKEALEEILAKIDEHGLGLLLNNFEIYDKQSNAYFEIDLILICTFGIYVIELKHWSGTLDILPYQWLQNGFSYKPDPHKINNLKAKLLKGLYEHRFQQYPNIFFESVVVLTNPEIEVNGASSPSVTQHNPTFAGIKHFIEYLFKQRAKGNILSSQQCEALKDYLETLRTTSTPRNFRFPGYEIVQTLYQDHERVEFIARRTDMRYRKLSRLRIFFPPSHGDEKERRRFFEKAEATLNAVAKIGDHPNILKVWDVPNDNNYIVEGSDWSQSGTLQDMLNREKRLSQELSKKVFEGILCGLAALHKEYVVHRFLSPSNILMIDEIPKLMNFDLSYQLEEDRITVIADGAKLKPSAYVAPEIYKTGTIPEATADLFSAGVLLFEMLTGARPLKSSTDLALKGGRLDDQHRQHLLKFEVDQQLIDIIFSLVCTDPRKRISSVDKVLQKLRETESKTPPQPIVNSLLQPGDTLGVYQIESFKVYGAESQVYAAIGPHARRVAVKVFNLDVPLKRVLNESDFAREIHHPCIIKYDNYGRADDGRMFIAFDWIEGTSLREEITTGNRPSNQLFVTIASQLLDAVQQLHSSEEQILHNDIKPDNVILVDGKRPILIDFGLASHPFNGTYEGSEGYVAPDLSSGQDREYCAGGDLYGLGVTLYEWTLGYRPSESTAVDEAPVDQRDISENILKWLERATAAIAEARFFSAEEMRKELENASGVPTTKKISPVVPPSGQADKVPRVQITPLRPPTPNPFVAYLNSLHCRDAGNQNALAESQVKDPYFNLIHVPHPLTDKVLQVLLSDECRHVILTGHAGDGKSTVAAEIYKRCKKIPLSEPLVDDLEDRIDTEYGGKPVTIIKDLSEMSDRAVALIREMLNDGKRRYLLVSNTGTLLDTFKEYEREAGGDLLDVEDHVLSHIQSNTKHPLDFQGTPFHVINMSLIDNLGVAEKIYQRIVDPQRWKACQTQECRVGCPIYRNVSLIQANTDIVRNRIFLAYRRLHEYGIRLTLRQLCGHISYIITSGLNYQDILAMGQKADPPPLSNFMFFNRFFGDDGQEIDRPAMQISAVKYIREQGFGSHLCPSWERRLWMESETLAFDLIAQDCKPEFDRIRRIGNKKNLEPHVDPAAARQQVRRMLYFLHKFGENEDQVYVRRFLNSAMILDFDQWQKQVNHKFSLQQHTQLRQKVLHVLHEHFTGIRLPEGTPNESYLYITLSRRASDVRQSAQIVVTRQPLDSFKLQLIDHIDSADQVRRELVVVCEIGKDYPELRLGLPFLDYVMMRNQGEVGQDIQASYLDRLERFKGQIAKAASARDSEDIMLVRLRTNFTFKKQVFAVRRDRLEVTDG